MFSKQEKIEIAQKVEELLLSYNHPEMPKEKPNFSLQVKSIIGLWWAEILPNWHYENKEPSINPWNEGVRERMKERDS